jgi:Do/DeqQ family serine protease
MNGTVKKTGILIFAAFLGGAGALGLNQWISNRAVSGSIEARQQASPYAARFASINGTPAFDFTAVAEIATAAVVHIKTTASAPKTAQDGMPQQMDPFGFFNNPNFRFEMPNTPRTGSGSGVIVTDDGYIITNNHVVNGATKIEVVLNDKRTFVAELVGADPNTDIALIRIDQAGLPFLKYGNSESLKVGQWVVAVGNPFNLTSTVTSGIISAMGRNIDLIRSQGNKYAIENFIQTDAAINPGNSGGALVNTGGELIGINTAIASETGSYVGYGFAIPVNLVKKVVDDLLNFGKVQRGLLGVSIQDITQELADRQQLKSLNGVYVAEVVDGGAAKKAGVKQGDVIIGINGVAVNSSSALQGEVGKYRPGDKLKVKVLREGLEKELEATLQSEDGKTATEVAKKSGENEYDGLKLQPSTKEERTALNLKNGVRVESVDGVFKSAGIRPGFIITHIENEPVYSTSGAVLALQSLKGSITIEGKYADGKEQIYAVKLPTEKAQ